LLYFSSLYYTFFVKSRRSVTGRQYRRPEAAFAARLAWHGPENHWQSSRRVAWPSSCMCLGKGWTLKQLLWHYQ